jgi:dihydrofolate reductase
LPRGGTAFNFVLDGVEAAVDNATSAADGKHVLVMGGANVVQQCLQAGLVDEMQLHLVPVLFGNGIRLFEHLDAERTALETIRVIETPAATHLRFRVLRRRQ